MKRILFILLLLNLSLSAYAYKIEVHIKNAKDSVIYLVMHHGNSKFVKDTAQLNSLGKAVFEKKDTLQAGMYLIAMNGVHLFDFMISDNDHQQFKLTCTKDNYIHTLQFKNSEENQTFAQFTLWMFHRQATEKQLLKLKDTASVAEFDKAYSLFKQEYIDKLDSIKTQLPTSLLYALARSMQPIDVPKLDLPKDNPKYDSVYYWFYHNYNSVHFWDNFDLTDVRMQNTPILLPSLERYLDQILIQKPDSIIKYTDLLLAACGKSEESRRFFAGHIFNKYMASAIMGMENIVIHLIDQYYLTGKIHAEDKFLNDVADYANKYRNTLIGKKAENLKMETLNGQFENLYDVKAPYTIVYFFEPNCGHCKKETPKVYDVYQKYKNLGVSAYCVYSQSNKQEWQKYIIENRLEWINVWDPNNENDFRIKYSIYLVPQLYLLDKDKNIIGRRLNADSLDQILKHLLKQ